MKFANNVITTAWMSQKYKEFNEKYFYNYLKPMHKFIVSKRKSFLGQFKGQEWSIELSTFCNREEDGFINTMLHEMCHAYVRQKYGVYAKSHGREWKEIAELITSRTNGKYGNIKRCGGALAIRPDIDTYIEKKVQQRMSMQSFIMFTDCYGFMSVVKCPNKQFKEKFFDSVAIKQNTELYIIHTDMPQLTALPIRRSVRWNELRKFVKPLTEDDVFNYPATYIAEKYRKLPNRAGYFRNYEKLS